MRTHAVSAMPCKVGFSTARQKLAISDVTMFLPAARLISSAPLSLPKGESAVIFTNVARTVDAASIMINASNSVVVGAATFEADDDDDDIDTILSPRARQITEALIIIHKSEQQTRRTGISL